MRLPLLVCVNECVFMKEGCDYLRDSPCPLYCFGFLLLTTFARPENTHTHTHSHTLTHTHSLTHTSVCLSLQQKRAFRIFFFFFFFFFFLCVCVCLCMKAEPSDGEDAPNELVLFQSPHRRRIRLGAEQEQHAGQQHRNGSAGAGGGRTGLRQRAVANQARTADTTTGRGSTASPSSSSLSARAGVQEELPDLLQRWLEYWVCFGVLTSMERVPLVSTAVAAVLPYGSLLSVTLRLWLVVPLVHGTHALFLLLRTYVLTSAVSTAAAVSRGSPAMRSVVQTVAAQAASARAALRFLLPGRVQRGLGALGALFTDTYVFLIAVPAFFSPRFMTRFAAALVAFGYPAYKTTMALEQARRRCAVPSSSSSSSSSASMTRTAATPAVVRAETLRLLGMLKYWVVLMVVDAVWHVLTDVTRDVLPLWWDAYIVAVVALQLPAVGAAAFLFDDFRVSPLGAVLRWGSVASATTQLVANTARAAAAAGGGGGGGALDGGSSDDSGTLPSRPVSMDEPQRVRHALASHHVHDNDNDHDDEDGDGERARVKEE